MSQLPSKPYGVPLKTGHVVLKNSDWQVIREFIEGESWNFSTPCQDADLEDPLLKNKPNYGALFLGFDFHPGPQGPKLIEINTNAGGFSNLTVLSPDVEVQQGLRRVIVDALLADFEIARPGVGLKVMAIVDDDIRHQPIFQEMQFVADLMTKQGVTCHLLSPEDLPARPDVQLIYNRLTDFRLEEPAHAYLRESIINDRLVCTPHPAIYARVADKNNFLRMNHSVIPRTFKLDSRPLDEWYDTRKQWVFKPATGSGAKGVYRGDKISLAKLKTLAPTTLVQEFIPPNVDEDGARYDIRAYTAGSKIMGVVARQFTGQVMEMRSPLAGFKRVVVTA